MDEYLVPLPLICRSCGGIVRSHAEHEPFCSSTGTPNRHTGDQEFQDRHGLTSRQRLHAIELLQHKGNSSGFVSPIGLLLTWGNGYWQPIVADYLYFWQKHATLNFSVGEVADAEQERRHPTAAIAVLQAADLWQSSMYKVLDEMDYEGVDLFSRCAASTLDVLAHQRRD